MFRAYNKYRTSDLLVLYNIHIAANLNALCLRIIIAHRSDKEQKKCLDAQTTLKTIKLKALQSSGQEVLASLGAILIRLVVSFDSKMLLQSLSKKQYNKLLQAQF